ncbi:MAG: hypothetical protein Dasosvirus3_30 [Dasosvirus sp.]|uniref:Uncharacterized protein n=1 Tax=Dasosvirus sp. TaxID=2487764 RepID=A0A3G4ZTZ6_9VIRU|nr:MAG: hypothetical protein Dasosvirus3_30 [Dasosvirus sp.]
MNICTNIHIGQIIEYSHYCNGEKHGLCYFWHYRTGKFASCKEYFNGKLVKL